MHSRRQSTQSTSSTERSRNGKVLATVPGKADDAHSAEGGAVPGVWPAHPPTVLRSPQILDSLERRTVPPSPPMTMCTPGTGTGAERGM